MKNPDYIQKKIFSLPALMQQMSRWKFLGKKTVFTNGCFDILHKGHIFSLSQAAKEGDFLIVGINSDDSVRRLKSSNRPVNDHSSRALLIASLVMVDAVVVFDEDTPLDLINAIQPDVLVKGGDYTLDQIVGSKEVIAYGGKVVINPIVEGYSTTFIIEKINAINES
jgi:D-beta-D-heptose 7-phosphate kinase/D-beta-D-heptose 1-phosphate adenosyltransferase